MSEFCFALHGAIAYSQDEKTLITESDAYVICEDGISKGVFQTLPEEYRDIEVVDAWDKLIIPGLVDLKAKAVEYQIRGMKLGHSLSEYQKKYASKEQRLYADELYAERAYDLFVEDILLGATSRVIIEEPDNEETSEILTNMLDEAGIPFGVGEADALVQCPTEELNFAEGFSPVRQWMKSEEVVGLGSGMGDEISMLKVMKAAIQTSKLHQKYECAEDEALTLEEVFYLATKGGGQIFGNCGSFEEGYQFDAVILDDGNQDTMRELSVRDRLERMLYLSDERNIHSKFVYGEKLY